MTSEAAFLVDFLPVIRRTLTRTGFVIDHVHYYCDALKPWIARREQLGRFVLRRDPRDISRIWVLDPDGATYLEVPYRTLSRPPISAWEQQAAVARLREQGRAEVDENALFAMVGQMREITDAAAAKTTRKARRDAERRSASPPGPPPAHRPCRPARATAAPQPRRRSATSRSGDMDQELTDLSHLHDAAQQVARLPAAERLRHVRADRWIGYTRATEALARLETLFEWPARQRMPNLLLTGPTNNGKSMIIEKFRRAAPAEVPPRTASTSRCWPCRCHPTPR